jgi:hypothetical protein
MTILPFAMKDGSSILGNEERFFHHLEGGRTLPPFETKEECSSMPWNEERFFHPSK